MDFDSIAQSIGLPQDQARIVFTILLTIPIGYSTRFIKTSVNIKHGMNIALGIFFGYICMGYSGFTHTIISSLVAYLMCITLPIKMAVNLVWIWTLAYMLMAHVVRTFYHEDGGHLIDYCVTQMILTTKLTSFATNLSNAELDPKELEKNSYWNRHAIREKPNLLQFFGYIFFYPTYVLGPSIEYNDYIDYVTDAIYKNEKNNQCPPTLLRGLRRLFDFIVIFVLKSLGDTYFPYRFVLDPKFATYNIFYRFFYFYIASIASRMIYEGVWVFVNSTLIFCGYAYNGRDKENNVKWDRGNNINILKFELAPSPRDMSIHWNISIALWLRHHVYERFSSKNTVLGMYCTNILSAFWHGIYPGLYFSFFLSSVAIEIARLWRSKISSRIITEKSSKLQVWSYEVFCIVAALFAVNCSYMPFVLLSFNETWTAFGAFNYIQLISFAGVLLFLRMIPSNKPTIKEIKDK